MTWASTPPGHVNNSEGGLIVLRDRCRRGRGGHRRHPAGRARRPLHDTGTSPSVAKMRVGPAWTFVPPRASLVVGGGVPSTARPADDCPNVLFISDGFVAAQHGIFDTMVDTIVERLRQSKFMRPYDLLAESINFWRVFVPSEVPGVSCRDEVYTRVVAGAVVATALPAPERPPATSAWTLPHLVYLVGYPVTTNGDAAAAPAALRAAWVQMLTKTWSDRIADVDVVTDTVLKAWQALSTRTSIDEIDGGFPASRWGSRLPRKVGRSDAAPAPDRGGRDVLNDFSSPCCPTTGRR